MSFLDAVGVGSRSDDWVFAAALLVIFYFLLYPFYILYLRYQKTRTIKRQLVTSMYKLPLELTPTEFAYVFSTKVSRQQLYATLLDLANRSILILHKKDPGTIVEIGPKVDNTLKPFEKMLVGYVHSAGEPLEVERVLVGYTNYGLVKGERISGSRHYVFWWLLRQHLRERGLIERHMTGRYTKMLFNFGVLGSLFISTGGLVLYSFVSMLFEGEVDNDRLIVTTQNGLLFWALSLAPMFIISLAVLRFRGRVLGREWLLTPGFKRYLGQLIAFREFVRLTHKKKLRFESKELKKESIAFTKPFAIAFGYVKE